MAARTLTVSNLVTSVQSTDCVERWLAPFVALNAAGQEAFLDLTGLDTAAAAGEFLVRLFDLFAWMPKSCRERPPWRSVMRQNAPFLTSRNATEGVPYRTQTVELIYYDQVMIWQAESAEYYKTQDPRFQFP